jgi:HAD superfamily hydrolase (TIGR01509 family)
MAGYKCIIFDSDGVLVDSETLSARVFQEMALELGFQLDFERAMEQFVGTSMKESIQFIEESIPGPIPDNFEQEFRRRTYEVFKRDLKAVPGIHEVVKKLQVPFCVASSGPAEKVRLNLGLTGLLEFFEDRIFSSYDIGKWKPDPGIFVHAASAMGFSPEECLVIEDSANGITAAINGGFMVFALAKENRKEHFQQLGAVTFSNMKELEKLLGLVN